MMDKEFEEYKDETITAVLRVMHESEELIFNGIATLFGDEAADQCDRGYFNLRHDFYNLLKEAGNVDGKLVYKILDELRGLRLCELEFNALYDSYSFETYEKLDKIYIKDKLEFF